MKEITLIVQARMQSTRLPGKVLKPILDKPLLFYLMERLNCLTVSHQIILATTTDSADDAIAAFGKRQEIPVFRGSKDDVLDRYFRAVQGIDTDVIVRITADCPLIDPIVVDQVIQFFLQNNCDYVSNTLNRTFPRGMDVEVFSKQTLESAWQQAKRPEEREHVTLYMYMHPEQYRLGNVLFKGKDASSERWTVDTPEDFELVRLVIETLYPQNPLFTLQDIVTVLDKHPEWREINAHIEQRKLQD